jgi:hypothetical protein
MRRITSAGIIKDNKNNIIVLKSVPGIYLGGTYLGKME